MIITSSCGSNKTARTNILLAESWDTPYNMPPLDKIPAKDYIPALEVAIEEQDKIIGVIVADSTALTFEDVILALDNSDIMVTDIFNIFTMIEASASTPDLAKVNLQMMPLLASQQDKVLLNEELFAKIKGVWEIREDLKLDREQLRLTQKTYEKFVRGGALLNELGKERLSIINKEIAGLRVTFSQNLLAETNGFALELKRGQLEGLSNSFRDMALREGESRGLEQTWIITLQPSSMIPFLTFSTKRELRKELYQAYVNRGKNSNEYDNREIVKQISKLRLEKARILGYDNYAEYVTSQHMAGDPTAAYELLEEVWTPALELAKEELANMRELLIKDLENDEIPFEAWDWRFYAEKLRDKEFAVKGDNLLNFFTVEGVRSGAFLLANRLYGITFRPTIIPQYADNCSAYEVIDVDGKMLGILHMDLYTRPSKGQGAWCGFISEQRYEGGQRKAPVVSISCNFAIPKEGGKTLLTTDEVETLFHEFGHSLHFLFQDVTYRGLSEVEGDFVELPSQIMENWALEPEMLKLYAIHHSSGEVIPDNVVKNLSRSRYFNQGFMTLEVVAAALLDLDLHTCTDFESFDVDSFLTESLEINRGMITQINPRYRLPYFSHLFTFDYASGYYFYMWAEVLDKNIYDKFKSSKDIFSRPLAEKFRREILQRGGSEDGAVMFRNFCGEDPKREPLLIARGLMEPPKNQEEIEAEEAKARAEAELKKYQLEEERENAKRAREERDIKPSVNRESQDINTQEDRSKRTGATKKSTVRRVPTIVHKAETEENETK
ncbi:MAG: M3 family metallopeptidase [Rikenellaceae bacterium]